MKILMLKLYIRTWFKNIRANEEPFEDLVTYISSFFFSCCLFFSTRDCLFFSCDIMRVGLDLAGGRRGPVHSDLRVQSSSFIWLFRWDWQLCLFFLMLSTPLDQPVVLQFLFLSTTRREQVLSHLSPQNHSETISLVSSAAHMTPVLKYWEVFEASESYHLHFVFSFIKNPSTVLEAWQVVGSSQGVYCIFRYLYRN